MSANDVANAIIVTVSKYEVESYMDEQSDMHSEMSHRQMKGRTDNLKKHNASTI